MYDIPSYTLIPALSKPKSLFFHTDILFCLKSVLGSTFTKIFKSKLYTIHIYLLCLGQKSLFFQTDILFCLKSLLGSTLQKYLNLNIYISCFQILNATFLKVRIKLFSTFDTKLFMYVCSFLQEPQPTTFIIEFLIWSNDRAKKINGNRIASSTPCPGKARLDTAFSQRLLAVLPNLVGLCKASSSLRTDTKGICIFHIQSSR